MSHVTQKKDRIQKVLANMGLGSRRTIEQWIKEKKITINGNLAQLGDHISAEDRVMLNNRPIKIHQNEHPIKLIAYNKPEGEVCTQKDPENRTTIFDNLPKLKGERWISVGRLDINTSGLLLLTNDGQLANRLMHPYYQIEREYAVRVMGTINQEKIDNLFKGVQLEDGVARFTDIVDSGGTGINHWFHVCLLEGKNREVRRLWESQDLKVNRLKRVRFGSVIIPNHLKVGQWQELDIKAINELNKLVDLPSIKTPANKISLKKQQRNKKY